jgi:prephenate dehydrogenase
MQTWDTVAIVGVGLIGGSIGLALRRRKLARRVVGIGRRPESLDRARQLKAIHTGTTDLETGVADADLIVICTPVDSIVEHVVACSAAAPSDALITDAGSTKQHIVAALDAQLPSSTRFVGSHPLAGSEKTSVEHARADLFAGRVTVITPLRRTTRRDTLAAEQFWESLGSRVISMSPANHDAAVAATSHTPHVVAAALAGATKSRDLPLVAGGWLDTTRVAGGDEELWRQILLDNRENTLASLERFQASLKQFHSALLQQDGAQLKKLLRKGRKQREAAAYDPLRNES